MALSSISRISDELRLSHLEFSWVLVHISVGRKQRCFNKSALQRLKWHFWNKKSPLRLYVVFGKICGKLVSKYFVSTNIHFPNHDLLSNAEQIAVLIIVFHSTMTIVLKISGLEVILMSDSK